MPIDTNGLINDARCVANCIPTGMQMAVLVSLVQQIIANGGVVAPNMQTPWLSNIDAGGFNLTNVGNVSGETVTFAAGKISMNSDGSASFANGELNLAADGSVNIGGGAQTVLAANGDVNAADGVAAINGNGFVTSEEFETTVVGKGFILKSPNGTRWRINVSNAGVLSAALA